MRPNPVGAGPQGPEIPMMPAPPLMRRGLLFSQLRHDVPAAIAADLVPIELPRRTKATYPVAAWQVVAMPKARANSAGGMGLPNR